MTRRIGGALAIVLTLAGSITYAQRGVLHMSAKLEPAEEVPAVISPARGNFRARIIADLGIVEYSLSYDRLQGEVRQSHIHIAQPGVNGGIMVWLCGTMPTNPGPTGTQMCPQEGTISGVISAADVLAVTSQGIGAGDWRSFLVALRSGLAYVNVHTSQSPLGEIRGQVSPVRR